MKSKNLFFIGALVIIFALLLIYFLKPMAIPGDCPEVYLYADSLGKQVSTSEEAVTFLQEYLNGESVNEEISRLASYQSITSSTESRKIVRNRNTNQDIEEEIYLINGDLIGVKTDGSIYTRLFCL